MSALARMDISDSTVDRLDLDNNLNEPNVVTKYSLAAEIANGVMKQVVSLVVVGARIIDICARGDELILAETKKVHKKEERGIARPTCLCVNNIVRNSTPVDEEDAVVIKEGDMVKIDLGVHIDGYIAALAHTVIATNNLSSPTTGRAADVVCAAHYAALAAANLLQPGASAADITGAISAIAAHYNCTPVHSTFSRQVKRFLLAGGNTIPNSLEPEFENAAESQDAAQDIEAGDVYLIDVVLSTGDGSVKDIHQQRPNVLVRDVNRFYNLKSASSRRTLSTVSENFSVFPFPTRALFAHGAAHRIGVQECLAHALIVPEWMQIDPSASHVARFSMTVLVRGASRGTLRITADDLPLPYVHSEIDIAACNYASAVQKASSKGAKSKALPAPAATAEMDLS
ncbi:peptidase M24, structural domain-containing protein [Geranomyces variabilis]|nr:peptidase M24, structural domain-containing protein [Geranomyces variabilis]KAJ3133572.1 Proliferation-associated protein 2G4 [Geranomyces variabilis]